MQQQVTDVYARIICELMAHFLRVRSYRDRQMTGKPRAIETALSRSSFRHQFLSSESSTLYVEIFNSTKLSRKLNCIAIVYTLAHELAPGRYKPTLTHTFIRLLAEKGRLHTCFTQNIDTLERKAGVPPEKIVEAHGSFADQHCIDCGAPYPDDKMRDAIAKKEIARCERKKCRGLVKPDIVFFGESVRKFLCRS